MNVIIPDTVKNISTVLSIVGFSFIAIAILIILYEEGFIFKDAKKQNKN